jgi:hypothetical protein
LPLPPVGPIDISVVTPFSRMYMPWQPSVSVLSRRSGVLKKTLVRSSETALNVA